MKTKDIFISFVGTNDAGELASKEDGAILTALSERKFDEVHLLWNKGIHQAISFEIIAEYLRKKIIKSKYAAKVILKEFVIRDVADHNEIYPLLKQYSDTLPKDNSISYTASVTSGTPAMQVCWIMLAESGDFSDLFPLNIIRIRDPKFGKPSIIYVLLDTGLPRIKRLNKEVETLKKDLIPALKIDIPKGQIFVDAVELGLSPIEFSYYRYFAQRVIEEKGLEKFSGINVSNQFIDKILSYHLEAFPELESNRVELKAIRKQGFGLSIATFRGNISKINKKIREKLKTQTLIDTFEIKIEGIRGAKFYGLRMPPDKIIHIK